MLASPNLVHQREVNQSLSRFSHSSLDQVLKEEEHARGPSHSLLVHFATTKLNFTFQANWGDLPFNGSKHVTFVHAKKYIEKYHAMLDKSIENVMKNMYLSDAPLVNSIYL